MHTANDSLQSFLPEILLLLILGVMLGCNIDLFAIDPYSELFHITAAKESLQAGHFWLPVLNGHEYLIRAPLWTWIVESSFKVLGVSLWAARVRDNMGICPLGAAFHGGHSHLGYLSGFSMALYRLACRV